jgi:hypothetical protein
MCFDIYSVKVRGIYFVIKKKLSHVKFIIFPMYFDIYSVRVRGTNFVIKNKLSHVIS